MNGWILGAAALAAAALAGCAAPSAGDASLHGAVRVSSEHGRLIGAGAGTAPYQREVAELYRAETGHWYAAERCAAAGWCLSPDGEAAFLRDVARPAR